MALYRFLFLPLLAPLLTVRFLWRWATGGETRNDLAERLGRGPQGAARGPVVWLHGASVGELASARPLAELLLSRDPRLRLVVTANTLSGRRQVLSWGSDRVSARLAPLDWRWIVARFLAGWMPVALVTIENEIWPNRMAVAQHRRVPVLVAGARLSAGSAKAWGRFPRMTREILRLIDHLAPLDAASRDRFLALGVDPRRIGAALNLKAGVRPPDVAQADLAPFAALPRGQTVLAAATHPGEDEIVLAAFRQARAADPRLRLILAPRHPERGERIAGLCAATGLPSARRSLGQTPDADTAIYLADTLGEMPLWYSLAPVTFIGGSLVPKGGHTPFEPAHYGSALLHGPHVENHAEAYRALAAAGAACEIASAGALAAEIARLLADPDLCAAMAAKASEALGKLRAVGGARAFVARIGALTGNPALEADAGSTTCKG